MSELLNNKGDIMNSFIQYQHHGWDVWVKVDLQGKHRDHCLCFSCDKFKPDTSDNCKIAQAIYNNCVKFGITTPMWECPEFLIKE